MSILECEILFSDNDMFPIKNSSKFRKKSFKEDINEFSLIGNSVDQPNVLNLGNSVSNSSLSSLPKNLAEQSSEQIELEISKDDYKDLPQLLDSHINLNKLSICKRPLETLPDTIGELQNLCILNLSHSELKELPDSLSNLKNLELLDLSHNKLKELPDSLSHLKNLESLDLSYNKLENIPLSYAKLQRLKVLNISDNHFMSIPKCVENGMGTLKVLNISRNPNVKLNITPNSKYLEKFYARENKSCCKFPDWILTPKFFNLKEFDLDKTEFEFYRYVSKEGDLCLQTFSMACSNLSSPLLEMMIESMINLEKINVGNENVYSSGNIFNRIPTCIFKNPKFIRELDFRATSLPTVPSEINQLCNLQKIDLGLNCISWLPEEFCELQKLEFLRIDGNGLIMLPKNFGNLKSLKELRAENNGMMRLPQSFRNLRDLKIVDLYNNVIEEFPDVLSYMDNLQGLDLEQNFFSTDNLKIKEVSYSTLQCSFRSVILGDPDEGFNCRGLGVKNQGSIGSDGCESPDGKSYSICSQSEKNDSENESVKEESSEKKDSSEDRKCFTDENWDVITDSDDEFDPESFKRMNYNERSKQYIPLAPSGFCPADLHSRRIKSEVASMRVYGSLPSFNVEQGQFDDA